MFLDSRQRTVAIGVWIASFSAGAAIGPLVGGFLLERFWWGSVFLIGVPVMLLLLVLGPVLLPEFRDPAAGRVDLISAGMSLASVLSVIYGLKLVAVGAHGWPPAVWIAAGTAIGLAFVWRQLTSSDPVIDLRLFRIPAFSTSLLTYTLGIFVAFGVSLFIAQYLQLVLGMSPLRAGVWTIPEGLAFVLGSMMTPVLVRKVRPPLVVTAGLATASVGFAVIGRATVEEGLAQIVIGSVLFGLGLAAVFTLATDLVVGTAPPERAGAASALSETGAEFGGALGIAILGSIGTAVYRGIMTRTTPDGVPRALLADVQDTLGAAVAAASQIAESDRAELLAVARDAFARAFEIVNITAAIILVTAGVIAALLVRPVRADVGATVESP
jgi:MFS transporter, DHA2 family, multidrug resistance protein